jgi:hypothetical protein
MDLKLVTKPSLRLDHNRTSGEFFTQARNIKLQRIHADIRVLKAEYAFKKPFLAQDLPAIANEQLQTVRIPAVSG